eukprot:365361-Chlamydomonas_euryale.AAC.10
MESQDSPGPSAAPSDASGSEDHAGISLVKRFRSSNRAPQDSACFCSHINGNASSFESREGINEEGLFGSAPLSADASKNIASAQRIELQCLWLAG